MATAIQRPTKEEGRKNESRWRLYGTWGERLLAPMSRVELYRLLCDELVARGVLPPDSPAPSNRLHKDVTMTLMRCSWVGGRWVLDEPTLMAV